MKKIQNLLYLLALPYTHICSKIFIIISMIKKCDGREDIQLNLIYRVATLLEMFLTHKLQILNKKVNCMDPNLICA